MWEVRVADGQLEQLLAWVLHRVDDQAQVYRSADPAPRVVVIDPSGTAGTALGDVPEYLVARPAHSWDFEPVSNG
jgi:hypothetical protein